MNEYFSEKKVHRLPFVRNQQNIYIVIQPVQWIFQNWLCCTKDTVRNFFLVRNGLMKRTGGQ